MDMIAADFKLSRYSVDSPISFKKCDITLKSIFYLIANKKLTNVSRKKRFMDNFHFIFFQLKFISRTKN